MAQQKLRLTQVFIAANLLAFSQLSLAVSSSTAVPVSVNQVTQESYKSAFTVKGRVEATEDVALQAQVTAYLLSRHFTEGSFVEKGQLLFKLDDRIFQAKLAKATASLASANAHFNISLLEQQRAKPLVIEGSISQSEFDKIDAKKITAVAEVNNAEAMVFFAKTELSYTLIHAPFSGRVSDSRVAIGELISPSTKMLANLVKVSPIQVAFQLSEGEYQQARQKHLNQAVPYPKASVFFNNGQSINEVGEINYFGNRVDLDTGTVSFQAKFFNHNNHLLPGQYVEVLLTDQTSTQVLTVPKRSVQRDVLGSFVFIVNKQNIVQRRNVQLGQGINDRIIISQGLKTADVVITHGLQRVRVGSAVTIKGAAI